MLSSHSTQPPYASFKLGTSSGRIPDRQSSPPGARLVQSEARLAQYSQKLADESFEDYSPYDTYKPYKPRANNVRLMRVVVGMLAAGGTLMAAVQSAETTNPGQGFDVTPLPNLPWSVQQQSLGASVA